MPARATSPFAVPTPGLRIKRGAPALRRPTHEEVASYPDEARRVVERNRREQDALRDKGAYGLGWVEGRHFLLAGATGAGLGGALASAVLPLLGDRGSLTLLSRDLRRSLAYQTGLIVAEEAEAAGLGERFQWLNSGVATEGEGLEKIVAALQHAGADRVVYVNTVAFASCGLLPGQPPVYVKDVDDEGLFQWELVPLDERSVQMTRTVMGTLAVELPRALERHGIGVEVVVFADWRGSVDRSSRDPASPDYGRRGAYSTSLYLPKEILQAETSAAYGTGRVVIDVFLPVMKTQALGMIPGGLSMYTLYERLMELEGIRRLLTPELALAMLDRIGRAISGEDDNPFPQLDTHESVLDMWFYEVVRRLVDDESSDFYFRRWGPAAGS